MTRKLTAFRRHRAKANVCGAKDRAIQVHEIFAFGHEVLELWVKKKQPAPARQKKSATAYRNKLIASCPYWRTTITMLNLG